MYYLNKLVWFLINPLMLGLLATSAGVALLWFRRRRAGLALAAAGVLWLWFCSTGAAVWLFGAPLEREYRDRQAVASLPAADAIVVLGGGVGQVDALVYPELFEAADRVWHAARLYQAGKAPLVVVSGMNDECSTVPLLLELGVPRAAIVVDNESRNTYENSRCTERLLAERAAAAETMEASAAKAVGKQRVLLVTSAWHMHRAAGNFSRTSLEVIPAPCDFKATFLIATRRHWWDWLTPSADGLNTVNYLAKEWLGRLARK